MPSYLLLEDGGRITLEDGTGSILLEDSIAPVGDGVLSLCATHTTQPLAMFGGLDLDNALTTAVPANGTITLLAPPFVYGGPAILYFNPSGIAGGYIMRLQAQDPDGTWNDFAVRTTAPGRVQIDLFLPAQPIRLRVTDTTGAGGNVDAALMVDLHRVG